MAAKRRSARWWRKQTEEWEALGGEVTAKEFARERGFNAGTFAWWRGELRRRDSELGESSPRPAQLVPRTSR